MRTSVKRRSAVLRLGAARRSDPPDGWQNLAIGVASPGLPLAWTYVNRQCSNASGQCDPVVVLTWIGAILSILGGIVALLARENFVVESGLTTSQSRLAGGRHCLRHHPGPARLCAGQGQQVREVHRHHRDAATPHRGRDRHLRRLGQPLRVGAVINVLVALLVLWLLWNAKAGAFFAGG